MGGAWQGKTDGLKGKRDLPPPRAIAVDVDGTLHINGEPNTKAVAWLHKRKAEGYTLMLWSMRGEKHARLISEQMGCANLFDVIVSKPGYILDDCGWSWIKATQVVRLGRANDDRGSTAIGENADQE